MLLSSKKTPGWFGQVRRIVAGLSAAALLIVGVFNLTPMPGVLLIRALFWKNDRDLLSALQKHVPVDVTSFRNIEYRPGERGTVLDVHVPDSAIQSGTSRPTVVWVPGGAWIAGNKDEWAPYFQVLASRGYTVVGLDYTRSPAATYPTAVHQVNDALAYLLANAERFHIDPASIVLAGDSAGAQISTQIAAAVTNPTYADATGIHPAITDDQLKGTVLYCGIYDMANYFGAPGIIGWGLWVTTWAYTGNRGKTFRNNPALAEMSTINHATPDFPPTFISGGNTDPLTPYQSRPMAERLEDLGVDVTPLFYPDHHQPGLSHEYQFNLDTDDGQKALDATVAFLERVVV